jgi:SAM-dependent methyltransferase
MDAETLPLVEAACPVCGGSGLKTICTAEEIAVQMAYLPRFHKRRLRQDAPEAALQERASFTQAYATQIVRCRSCGLLRRDPRPSDGAISRMYAHDEYGHERLEEIFTAQRSLYRPKAQVLSRWLKPGAKVVEVGSFVGGFLAAGRDQGWTMLGIDPGAEVSAFSREKGLPVFTGTLDQASLCPESADAVAIWNTFDQLPDPEPTLSAARQLLRPQGIFALRVPNGEFFAAACRTLKRGRHTHLAPIANLVLDAMVWNNMLAFPYLYGYSVDTLDRLLRSYSFARRMANGDTLVRLADNETKPWAIWEERSIKLAMRKLGALEGSCGGSKLRFSPWIDLYYEKIA